MSLNIKRRHRMSSTYEQIRARTRSDCRVLLVDNDCACLAIVSKMLSFKGFQVSATTTADEALSTVRQIGSDFKLVVADFHLPGMVKYEFLHKLEKAAYIPVAVMSADEKDKSELDLQYWDKCADLCLVKPIKLEQLEPLWKIAWSKKFPRRFERVQFLSYQPPPEDFPDGKTEISKESTNREKNYLAAKRDNEGMDDDEVDSHSAASKRLRLTLVLSRPRPRPTWTTELLNIFVQAARAIGIDVAQPKEITQLMNVPGLTKASVTRHWIYWQKYLLPLERQGNAIQRAVARDIAEASWAPYLSSQLVNNLQGGIDIAPNMELLEGFGENVLNDYDSGNESTDIVSDLLNNVLEEPMQEVHVHEQEQQLPQPPSSPPPVPAAAEGEEELNDRMFVNSRGSVEVVFCDEDLDGLY